MLYKVKRKEGAAGVIELKPLKVDDTTVTGIEVALPKTKLLIVATDVGYIMCGALDIALLNERLQEREIVAARAIGVRTLEDLLAAPLESVTHTAESFGILPGMTGREALRNMLAAN